MLELSRAAGLIIAKFNKCTISFRRMPLPLSTSPYVFLPEPTWSWTPVRNSRNRFAVSVLSNYWRSSPTLVRLLDHFSTSNAKSSGMRNLSHSACSDEPETETPIVSNLSGLERSKQIAAWTAVDKHVLKEHKAGSLLTFGCSLYWYFEGHRHRIRSIFLEC